MRAIYDNLSRSQLEAMIDEWIIGANALRNRTILKDRLLDGLTYERLAEKHDLSVRQTKNIVCKCETILYRHFPG